MDYFTLRALAHEWDARLAGFTIEDAWTQSPRELSLAVARDGERRTLRVLCDPGLPLLFDAEGGGRQRRNTADVLGGLAGHVVAAVRTADRDRHVFFDLDGGGQLQVLLFGSRPNVFWTSPEGTVQAAFLDGNDWDGQQAPAPRRAPEIDTAEAFEARWRPRKTLGQTVAGAVPLLTRPLAEEAVRRAGLDPSAEPDADAGTRRTLFDAVRQFLAALAEPEPVIYWRGPLAETLALVPLAAPPADWRPEPFEAVDQAVRVFARRQLGQRAYTEAYAPVERALTAAHARRRRSADAMLSELSSPSRADRYEAWGHLLMAQAAGDGPGRESVALPDIIGGSGEPVEIPLDPALSAVENAERYYDKARRTRRARDEAEGRWAEVQAEADAAADLLTRLRATESLADLRTLLDAEAAALAAFVGQKGAEGAAEPFRRVPLPGGYEALVGKNARGNAHLTTRVASPHDLWLHARGVPGSHVVVKRPGRSTEVPAEAVRAAARVAAHFSTAKTQTVVPVTVTERKYVRPVKGGPPGLVRVDREDVLDVTPGLPR